MFEVNLYIETSLKGPRRADGWYGYVLEFASERNGLVTREGIGQIKNTTENELCITAVAKALQRLIKTSSVGIFTSNNFLISALEKGWLDEWSQNGWKNKHEKPISNTQQWYEIWKAGKVHNLLPERVSKHPYTDWIKNEIRERAKQLEVSEESDQEKEKEAS